MRPPTARAASGPAGVVKDLLITGVSIVAVLLAVVYIAFPPGPTMAMTVTSQAISGDSGVIYGKVVDAAGKPIREATVVVVRETGGSPVQEASLTTAHDGTFRVMVGAPFGTRRVIVSADVGSSVARDTITVGVAGGHAYGITAELVDRDYFLFLPIVTY